MKFHCLYIAEKLFLSKHRYLKIFQQHFVVVKSEEDENMHFCPQETIWKWEEFKMGKFSNYHIFKENYGILKSYICLMISSNFIDCFLQNRSKRSLFHLKFVLYTCYTDFVNYPTTCKLRIRLKSNDSRHADQPV